jgi:signal transduction histidine kinase
LSGANLIPFFSRVRVQLTVLLLLIFVPSLVLTIRASLNQKRIEKDKVREATVALAKLCAAKHETFAEKARQLLMTVSQIQFLSTGQDSAAAQLHFGNLCKLMPEYADFGLLNSNRTVFAAASQQNGEQFTNWSCFDRVVSNLQFGIGNLPTNGSSAKATLDLGYPIFDSKGGLVRVLYASLKTEELRKVTEHIHLPPQTTLTLFDREGIVLASFPFQSPLRGKVDNGFFDFMRESNDVFEKEDVTGERKLFARASLSDASGPALVISVAVPTKTSFAAANHVLWKNIAALCFIFLIVLVAAYSYSEQQLLRPLNSLVESARRLGANQWKPTSDVLITNNGELGELARTFDQMARTLEERQKQILTSHEHVRELNLGLEKRVQERTLELAKANQELERFSYSVSHDLRAPLRAMQSFATILKQDFASELSPEGIDYLERIDRAALRLDRLTNDILCYSRVTATKLPLEPVDLSALMSDVISTFPNLSKAHLVVDPLPAVIGQKSYLTQCFSNLIANAIKFVPADRKPRLKIWCETKNRVTRIWFEDNGIGIADQHRTRIFEIFERLNPHQGFEGTGIGLAIVRAAVERMSGSVGFESELGKGSRFWIELAQADTNGAQASALDN